MKALTALVTYKRHVSRRGTARRAGLLAEPSVACKRFVINLSIHVLRVISYEIQVNTFKDILQIGIYPHLQYLSLCIFWSNENKILNQFTMMFLFCIKM